MQPVKHYSSPKSVPFVAGIDGVGELTDGSRCEEISFSVVARNAPQRP
jgi:hypothetical protein